MKTPKHGEGESDLLTDVFIFKGTFVFCLHGLYNYHILYFDPISLLHNLSPQEITLSFHITLFFFSLFLSVRLHYSSRLRCLHGLGEVIHTRTSQHILLLLVFILHDTFNRSTTLGGHAIKSFTFEVSWDRINTSSETGCHGSFKELL